MSPYSSYASLLTYFRTRPLPELHRIWQGRPKYGWGWPTSNCSRALKSAISEKEEVEIYGLA